MEISIRVHDMGGKFDDSPVATFNDKVAAALAEVTQGALADIRQKVVEEPWFGKAVAPDAKPHMAVQLGWVQPGGGKADPPKEWNDLCDRLAKANVSMDQQLGWVQPGGDDQAQSKEWKDLNERLTKERAQQAEQQPENDRGFGR